MKESEITTNTHQLGDSEVPEITDFGDARVVIAIAKWRSKEVERKQRVLTTASWVETKVVSLVNVLGSEEHGIIGFGSETEYREFLENITHTLRPEPLREKFRSRAIDALLNQNKN